MIIDYPNSPTGKAYINKAVPPFFPNESGFGFKGIVVQSSDQNYVECAECGKWMKSISRHIDKEHMPKEDYKKKYGLYKMNPLTSDNTRLRLADNGMKSFGVLKTHSKWTKAQFREWALKGVAMARARKLGDYNVASIIEHQNKMANCEYQLKARLIEFIDATFTLPPNGSGEGKAITKVLTRRFGSVNEGFKHYDLPTRVKVGTTVWLTFKDEEVIKFNYNSMYDRIGIYHKIKEKSSLWDTPLNNINILPTNKLKKCLTKN